MTIIQNEAVVTPAKKWPALVPLVLAMCAVAAWVGRDVFTENGANLGYIIGNTVAVSAMVWVALYFCFVQKTGRKVGLIYWGILFATGIASGMSVSGYETMQAKSALRGISRGYSAYVKGESVDAGVHAQGDVGQVEGWIKNFFALELKDHQAYVSELDGAGVANLLLPANLKTDKGLGRAKAAVVRGREIVQKYHALYDRRLADAYIAIDKSNMNPSMKTQTKTGMDEGMAKSKPMADRIWALEAGAVEEMGAVVDLLAAYEGSWKITDKVVFENPDVVAAYNGHLAKLQEMANEEERLRAQARATTRGKMTELETLTK